MDCRLWNVEATRSLPTYHILHTTYQSRPIAPIIPQDVRSIFQIIAEENLSRMRAGIHRVQRKMSTLREGFENRDAADGGFCDDGVSAVDVADCDHRSGDPFVNRNARNIGISARALFSAVARGPGWLCLWLGHSSSASSINPASRAAFT